MIKRIPRGLNIFSRKNKCYVSLPITDIRTSFSRSHQTVTAIDGLSKVKAKYIVLCLNALAKFRKVRGVCHHPALMGNCSTSSHIS